MIDASSPLRALVAALPRYQLHVHLGLLAPYVIPFKDDPNGTGAYIRADELDALLDAFQAPVPDQVRVGTETCGTCGMLLVWAPDWQGWTCVVCDRKAYEAAEAVDGWRPIETAPKDGTDVLVWDGFDAMVSSYITIGGVHMEWTTRALCAEEPTHWRPLPLPPIPQAQP